MIIQRLMLDDSTETTLYDFLKENMNKDVQCLTADELHAVLSLEVGGTTVIGNVIVTRIEDREEI